MKENEMLTITIDGEVYRHDPEEEERRIKKIIEEILKNERLYRTKIRK